MILEVEDDILKNVEIVGGCNGYKKGITALVKDMNIYDIINKLSGITCGFKNTSCPDQLAEALSEIVKNK